jgi:ABC-type dipeptide/oligopeptide/nickel transport system permease component
VLRYLARRLLLAVPVLLGVATLVFALIHFIPGDPARAILGDVASEADVAQLRGQLGLDRPLAVQYVAFLGGLLRADLGTSLRTGSPVASQILERLPATFELALSLTGVSMPNFWLGPLLAIVFGVELGWLPVSGRGGPEHLVLPAISLGAALAAVLARMTRAALADQLQQPYVLAARARGVSFARAVLLHAFPNSLIPIVTLAGLQIGVVLTGAVITETIFAWPGIGRLLIQSIGFRDYPMVQGCILLIAVTYVGVNLMVDLLYGVLDPRIRYR